MKQEILKTALEWWRKCGTDYRRENAAYYWDKTVSELTHDNIGYIYCEEIQNGVNSDLFISI